jgi:hypothetical protein
MLRQSREAEAAAEAARAREAAEAERLRAEAEAERLRLAAALPPEPPQGEEGVVNVSLRLPTGAKCVRRFRDTEPLAHVRLYVQSLPEMESVRDQFKLLSNFPRKEHSEPQATLASLKLGKQIQLIVESISAEDEAE